MRGANLSWVELANLLATALYQQNGKHHPVYLKVWFDDGTKPLAFPIDKGIVSSEPPQAIDSSTPPLPQQPPPPQPGTGPAEGDTQAKRFSPCVVDIISVLETSGKPMTTSRIMTALARAGKEWSLSTVSSHLAEMVREGCLDNPNGVHPRGYRLPEWSSDDD